MNRQRGFTFIELMVASAASAIIILASSAFMLKALDWHAEVSARLEMNRHAREVFDILAYGGKANSAGNDGTKYVYSIRGRAKAPPNGLRKNYAFQYTSNKLTIMPDVVGAMSVTCIPSGAGGPLPPGCSGTPGPGRGGAAQSVTGWMSDDVKLNSGPRSVGKETVEVQFYVMHPYEIQRAQNPALFTDAYRAVFTLNRMEDDP